MNRDSILGYRPTPNTISITFADDGKPVVIARDNPNFTAILDKLKSDNLTGLRDLCSPAQGIRHYMQGKAEVRNGLIFVNGKQIRTTIVSTILGMIREGVDASYLLRFLELLDANPSQNSRDQLWDFVEKNRITVYSGDPVRLLDGRVIDCRGWLLLYKGVREDYRDQYSGKFLNKPGMQLSMARRDVDDNQNAGCSNGFHAGAYEYVRNFGSRKLLVLVNPADVGSVPNDCSFQKLRTCSYIVLKEVSRTDFEVQTTSFSDDGQTDYVIHYLEYEHDEDTEEAQIRAYDAEEALELFHRDYDAHKVVSIAPV